MVVLGLNLGHDGAACVVVDGRLKSALSRERLSRQKKQSGVDLPLVQRVLELADVDLADVEYVTFAGYGHGHAVQVVDPTTRRRLDHNLWNLDPGVYVREYTCQIGGRRLPGVFVQHHLSHCASVYYTSPFERAACLSMDASQDPPSACSLFALGEGLDLRPLHCPGLMIGNAYYHFTEQLGMGDGLFKAGSTMGLAAYGRPARHPRHEDFLQDFYSRPFDTDLAFIQWLWTELTGLAPFARMAEVNQVTMDVAATIQMIFEEVALAAAHRLRVETQPHHGGNLCLSGGSFLNCNANSRLKREAGFDNLYLFPGCGDDGTAAGSALFVAHHLLREPRPRYAARDLAYLGGDSPPERKGRDLDLDLTVDALTRGKVVGWHQGRSEFGPRALGHRSLLADPRSPTMRDHLNHHVKHREWFRPFAPAVLEEKAGEWFTDPGPSPYMLLTSQARRPEIVPAISHVDGSARVQTVSANDEPLYYELIERFSAATGVPMLLNTSFNRGGEPLVESAADSFATFMRSNVDVLVVGDQMYFK
jgi:carbamoyltransferase